MFLSRIVVVLCALYVFSAFPNAKPEISIFQELRCDLASRKLVVGVNLKTGEVVGTGVCEGGDRPHERARLAALADIVSQLNESTFSSFRVAESSGDAIRSKEVIDMACCGYLIGAEEVARIVRQTGEGESVAVAFRWSVAMQKRAMSALSNNETDTDELEVELQKSDDLFKKTGPILWTSSSGRQVFLGIAAFKVLGAAPREFLSAMRMAKLKAQGYLAEHFRRVVTQRQHLCEELVSNSSTSVLKALNSYLNELKNQTAGALGKGMKSIVVADCGVSEIVAGIKTIGNVKYAVSVCCLTVHAR